MKPWLTVPFTAEELRQRLKYYPATGIFTNPNGRNPNRPLGTKPNPYIKISVPGSTLKDKNTRRPHYAQRLAWMWMTGKWPAEKTVDHENRIKSDNRWDNLRLATLTDQRFNMAPMKNNRFGVGVRPSRNRWRAQIQKHGKPMNLGTFTTQAEAVSAYETARRELAGKFDPTSSPQPPAV